MSVKYSIYFGQRANENKLKRSKSGRRRRRKCYVSSVVRFATHQTKMSTK